MRKFVGLPVPLIVSVLLLGGCTAQVDNTALNMQESYKALLTKQILYNLGEADRQTTNFVPSQIVVSGGSAQSSNSITPSLSVPLPGLTTGAMVSAAPTGSTFANSQSTAWGAPGLSVGVSDSWQLNWALTPQNDPDELSRLRLLYLFATGHLNDSAMNACRHSPSDADEIWQQQIKDANDWLIRNYVMQGGRATPNPAFAQEPNCVLCQDTPALVPQSKLTVNPALKCGFISTTQMNGFEYFGRYGITPFYVRTDGGRQDFIRFTFFILEAMSNTAYASYNIAVDKTTTGEKGITAPKPQILGPFPPKTQSITPFALPL